ncbi:MAG: OmpA family protein [Pseudomonadota bacterium]
MKNRSILALLATAVFAIPLAMGCAARCVDCGKVIKVTVLDGVNFDFNKSVIKPEGKVLLDKDVDLLKRDKTLDISVEGHCDIIGSDDYNQKLSDKRAQVVYDYFALKGIETRRMHTVGWGRKRPLVPNTTAANRAKNRRVEVNVIKARPK